MSQPNNSHVSTASPPKSEAEQLVRTIFTIIPLLGLVCIITALILAFRQQHFSIAAELLMIIGHLFIFSLFLKTELANLKYYLHISIYAVLVIGIAVVIYLFANQYTHKFDLTAQRKFSLSDESVKYLSRLDDPVSITVMSPEDQQDYFDKVKTLYSSAGKNVSWQMVDPQKEPDKARSFGDGIHMGDIFVKSKSGSSKKVTVNELGADTANAEGVITNAIIEVTRKTKPKIYFLQGHGEFAFDAQAAARPGTTNQSAAEPSVSGIRQALSDRAMVTAPLTIAETGGVVPADASAVVIAGPTRDIFTAEAKALSEYLGKNGKLFVLLGPNASTRSIEHFTTLKSVLTPYGIDLPDQVVLDYRSVQLHEQATMPMVASYDPKSPITASFAQRPTLTLLPLARPVVVSNVPAPLQGVELLKSSPLSWSMDSLSVVSGGQVAMPARNSMKPQTLAASVGPPPTPSTIPGQPAPKPTEGPRLLVFGYDGLISDQYVQHQQYAFQLMLNSMNWLAQQEDFIAIAPHEVKGTPIELNKAQLMIILVVSLMIPEAILFGGISYALLRRRN